MKKCWVCKQDKKVSEFDRDSKGKDGRRAYCKTCGSIAKKYRGVKQMRLAFLLEQEKMKYRNCLKSLSGLYSELQKKGKHNDMPPFCI